MSFCSNVSVTSSTLGKTWKHLSNSVSVKRGQQYGIAISPVFSWASSSGGWESVSWSDSDKWLSSVLSWVLSSFATSVILSLSGWETRWVSRPSFYNIHHILFFLKYPENMWLSWLYYTHYTATHWVSDDFSGRAFLCVSRSDVSLV